MPPEQDNNIDTIFTPLYEPYTDIVNGSVYILPVQTNNDLVQPEQPD
jgi:hypothetical protein